jgi:succinate dehydrogenase / fumarate reductase cytochrome b subunit
MTHDIAWRAKARQEAKRGTVFTETDEKRLQMESPMLKQRPKHLDLAKIRLPLPGIVSILHRVSGAALFLSLPVLIYLLHGSLSSAESFESYRALIANPLAKLVLLGLLWAYLHHACAGTRFLFLDIHKGVDLPTARATARIVLIVSLALTLILGVALW